MFSSHELESLHSTRVLPFSSFDEPLSKLSGYPLYENMVNSLKTQLESSCNTYPKSSAQLQPNPPTVSSSGNVKFGDLFLLALLAYFFIKTYVWTFIAQLFTYFLLIAYVY